MSETETHIGKARKVVLAEGQTKEDWFKNKCEEKGYQIGNYDSWKETLQEYGDYNGFVIVNDEIWEVFEHRRFDYEDIAEATTNPDGSVSFVLQFYNGGCCFSEALESALED